MGEILLNRRQYLEFEKLAIGVFSPLDGFMDEDTFISVVNTLRIPDGTPFPLPVVLDINPEVAKEIKGMPSVALVFEDIEVGELFPESFFSYSKKETAQKVFGTNDINHPGVALLYQHNDIFVGGKIILKQKIDLDISTYELSPAKTREIFLERDWKTIVGFQTRNVPHRAHEYLQRIALEHVDGLFIQPLIGRKKVGDYTPEAIMTGYRALVDEFYPSNRVLLGTLSTYMRYAGPREAILHAIIRRNYGCTHFIVGRDHAGVGDYYGKYEAHKLISEFDGELGIKIMKLHGPYFCEKCGSIVTEQTCAHLVTAPKYITEISGTDIRNILQHGSSPNQEIMRKPIINSLKDVALFVTEEES